MRIASVVLLLSLWSQQLWGQVVLNNNPSSVKWYAIRTPNFKVLYPYGFEAEAQRMANTLEHIRPAESRTLGIETRRTPVVLQNLTSVSNGFVSILPRRSEWFAMPPQNYNFANGTMDWLDQLASHEFRHVAQYDRARTGFNKLLYYMFGPATLAAMSSVAVPAWFWEGDAVATETAFSYSGRGRIPYFNLVLRTNLLEGRSFNYHKQYLRSYKHNITDHYVLGYHMVGYLRERTQDPMVWERITRRSWSVPFWPFTFSNAIHRETGLYVTDLYEEMAADLQRKWSNEIEQLDLTSFEIIHSRQSNAYTDYFYPQELADGRVLVLKRGIGDIIHFVTFDNGTEKRVFIPGIYNDAGQLSVEGNYVVWNEFGYHPRWRMQNYSVIKMYDVATRKLKIVTNKTRYTAAALSPDQTKIATIEADTLYQTFLVVLDTAGNVLKKFPNNDKAFYSMPRWSDDGKEIIVLKTTREGRSIASVAYPGGREQLHISYTHVNIGHPVKWKNYILFNSPESGIDNIYALDIETKERKQITSSKYGAYNPEASADGQVLYYNEQSRDGMNVVKIPIDPASWRTYDGVAKEGLFSALLTDQEGHPQLLDSIPQKDYPHKRYHKLSGAFNPYSWGAYFNNSLTQADIGISSQDVLSTIELKAGYLYDINERTGAWRAGVSYQNWFPILDVNFTYATRAVDEGDLTFLRIDSLTTSPPYQFDSSLFVQPVRFDWKERTLQAGFRIPLITTNSRYHGQVTFSNYVGVTKVNDFRNNLSQSRLIPFVYRSGPNSSPRPVNEGSYFFRTYVGEGTLLSNQFTFSAYRLLKQSKRDINSKWGQQVFLNSYTTPYGGDYSGSQFSFYSILYFPGLFKHHSLWGYWAYQGTAIPVARASGDGLDNYIFRNQIPLPRGISISRFQKFYSMSANYTMPVWYPDIAVGPLVNLQRVRLNGFIDYGFGTSTFRDNVIQETYLSLGAEVRVDINAFRLLEEFNVGFRYSYGVMPSTVTRFEILFGGFNF